jgi:biotin transport system substrate-specific component
MLLYLVIGAAGLPVFAGGSSGVEALFGATGGYLLSFPLCAAIAGLSSQTVRGNRLALTACFFVVHLVLLLLGSTWLGQTLQLDAAAALENGFTPFLPGALVKSALGAWIVAALSAHRRAI